MENIAKNISKKKIEINMKGFFAFNIRPKKQFRNLIIVWFILFAGLTAYHINILRKIGNQTLYYVAAENLPPAPKLNDKKLKSVLERFEAKKVFQQGVFKLLPSITNPEK